MPGRTPGSIYPKKTVFVPHDHPNGLGIAQAVNAIPIAAPGRASIGAIRSTLGVMDARAAAASQVHHGATAAAQAALSRRSSVGDLGARMHESAGLRQNQRGARELSHFSDVSDRPAALPPKGMVGSSPSLPVNPVAKANKDNAEASMDKVVDSVLQSPSIGVGRPTLVIPKWENGRRR